MSIFYESENMFIILKILRQKDYVFRECFISYVIHKFRMSFGKHQIVRYGAKVLVAYSGGHASAAMAHLILCVSMLNKIFYLEYMEI